MISKNDFRRSVRSIRDLVDTQELQAASNSIQTKLLGIEAIRDAKTWFVYASTGKEVDTHHLIRLLLSRGDVVTVPRIVGPGEMIARQIQSFDELQLSEFGIRAPPSGDSYRGIIDVCVCPGLAFSETGDRIGGGLGFYDRYLAHQPPRVAIGLVLERMVKPWLPVDSHDRRMDYVVTENRVIHVDRASR